MCSVFRPEFRAAGDSALTMGFPGHPHGEASERVRQVLEWLDNETPAGVTDAIPARTSLLIMYDPLDTSGEELQLRLSALSVAGIPPTEPRLVEIPVHYGGEEGQDLVSVAAESGLKEEQVIELHASVEYTVYFLGFMPGFAYMGPLPEALRSPRLATPRPAVPAGSVAIADDRTAIYPVQSPGGWKLLGRTRLKLFDPAKDPPALLRPGDRVRFLPMGGSGLEASRPATL